MTSTIKDSCWRVTHGPVQPPIFTFIPPSPLSALSPLCPYYTQTELKYTHSAQANADTWQIKVLINSLCWTIAHPHHQWMKNKQTPRQSAGPGHLVGLSVDDWVAQGCLVWGLGWSHNCFLWAAQPPEPLHNWLCGWYSPPPSHSPNSSVPLPAPTLLLPPFLPFQSVSKSVLTQSDPLNTFPVAEWGWRGINAFIILSYSEKEITMYYMLFVSLSKRWGFRFFLHEITPCTWAHQLEL